MDEKVIPFEEVYERYKLDVYRFCLFQMRDPGKAEDIAADVFVSAFKAYERSRPEEDRLRAWLILIAKNACISAHRRNQRWLRAVERFVSGHAEATMDVESASELRTELREVQRALSKLNEKQRTLIGLRCAAELPYEEIGEIMKMTPNAAAMATYRALERLRMNRKS